MVLAPVINAVATDIPAYKGVLRVLLVDGRVGNKLLLQYRTKTRQVLRVGIRGAAITNNESNRVIRLPNVTASITAGLDAGELHADIEYDGLNLTHDDYRVDGSLTVYLAGTQQTRNFRVYLKPRSVSRPANSSINWGIDNK
jgi:hypothetical protein